MRVIRFREGRKETGGEGGRKDRCSQDKRSHPENLNETNLENNS